MEQAPVVIDLSPTELEFLARPANGRGGYQSMLRRLQKQIQGGKLTISQEEAEHLRKYAGNYGQGGFQGRLKSVADKIDVELRNRSGDS